MSNGADMGGVATEFGHIGHIESARLPVRCAPSQPDASAPPLPPPAAPKPAASESDVPSAPPSAPAPPAEPKAELKTRAGV